MAEQTGTPGSTADTSMNGSKVPAPKDKACPFCHQPFTSSSLGRHLDLYIKEKNPRPADGMHDVDEIRKMREGITRRQPRNSTSQRELSTPAGTPGTRRRSPLPDSDDLGKRSPSLRRGSSVQDLSSYNGKHRYVMNRPSWEATGVINHIPAARNGDGGRGWDGEERVGSRRVEPRNRSVSKHILAKTTFEQKEKMVDALDNARAAELALRELLGAIRAAKQRIDGGSILDYDPLALDFPALTLKCLPPPPTLHQSNPFPTSNSWSIGPPGEQQYQALRSHFAEEFRRWRVSCTIATTAPNDDLSYPLQPFAPHEDLAEVIQRAEAESVELENEISEHMHNVFTRWTSISSQRREELWTLELVRNVGTKSEEINKLKKERQYSQQEISHLKIQIDELSRLQHPREFKLSKPETLPIDSKLISWMADNKVANERSVGWSMMDRNVHIDTVVERAIGRWKSVVKEARGSRPESAGRPAGQLSFSGEPLSAHSSMHQNQPSLNQNPAHGGATRGSVQMTNGPDPMGSDPDVDADADMEEDDGFVEMAETSLPSGHRDRETAIAQAANFRLANNGYGNSTSHQQRQGSNGGRPIMEGIENQTCVGGYVRIGA